MSYKIEQAISALKDLKVTSPPKEVFTHMGTNNLTSNPNQAHNIEIKRQYEENLKVSEKFPDSTIHIFFCAVRIF